MSAFFARYGTSNMVLPPEGPKVFGFNLDFRTPGQDDTEIVDLTLQIQQGFISQVSGFFIDCRLATSATTITMTGTNQQVSIPSGKQAYMPAFVLDEAVFTVVTTPGATVVIPFYPVNFPVTPLVW